MNLCEQEFDNIRNSQNIDDITAFIINNTQKTISCFQTFIQLWQRLDQHIKNNNKETTWKNYRFIDTLEVCAQEAERVLHCIQRIPAKELLGKDPLMLLEQRYGLWQDYATDDSDDEDWNQETEAEEDEDEDIEEVL